MDCPNIFPERETGCPFYKLGNDDLQGPLAYYYTCLGNEKVYYYLLFSANTANIPDPWSSSKPSQPGVFVSLGIASRLGSDVAQDLA